MEHTAGPWGVMFDGPKGDRKPWKAYMESAAGLTIGCDSNTEPVCRVSGYLMPVDANARLIAAAPALLSALEGQGGRGSGTWHLWTCPKEPCLIECQQARAAILAAKGEANA